MGDVPHVATWNYTRWFCVVMVDAQWNRSGRFLHFGGWGVMAILSAGHGARAADRLRRTGHFWWLTYAMFILLLGSTVPTPLYELYRQQWHLSTVTMTVVFACYVLGVLGALVFGGHLSDYVGRRPVALAAGLFTTVGTLVFTIASSVVILDLARVLTGLSVGLCTGALTAALRELSFRPERGALASSAATSAGLAAGPLLGGIGAQWAPAPLRTVYLGYLVLLIPAILALLQMPETNLQRRHVSWRPRVGVPANLRAAFIRPGMAIGCAYAVNGLYSALVPTLAGAYLGASLVVGSGMVVVMLGVSAIVQLALRRRPADQAQREGLWLLSAGLVALLPALMLQSLTLFTVITAVIGLGQGLSFRGSLTLISEIAPNSEKGRVISAYYVLAYVATAVPVLVVGAIAESVNLLVACAAFSASIGAVAVFATLPSWAHFWRQRHTIQ